MNSGTIRNLLISSGLSMSALTAHYQSAQAAEKPNVLFLAVDDWNDWVGCLGNGQVKTPNLDRLAAQGMLFTNAHCAAPVCNPSRSSVMTGLRPSTTGVYENQQPGPFCRPKGHMMIPQYFRAHGWHTAGSGKIYHDWPGAADPADWDEYYFWNKNGKKFGWFSPYSKHPVPQPDKRPASKICRATKRNFDWAALPYPDSAFPDFKSTTFGVNFLKKKHDKPFFLAVGQFRPHIPWFVPEKYFDMYKLDEIKLPPYLENDLNDVPNPGKKLARTSASKHSKVKELGEWKKAMRGYMASISFSDAQVGRLLKALEKSDYKNNTIVVLWSDHGYHLGEKEHWHKRTLWERATRVPLIIKAPGVTKAGVRCNLPVSLMDLYPTLLELSGLPAYSSIKGEGRSLVPLLKAPKSKWKYPAVTTYKKDNHAVRSQNFRYIRYSDGTEELYDHRNDPNEWHNLAQQDKYVSVIKEHKKWLPKNNAPTGPSYYSGQVLLNPETMEWKLKKAAKGDKGFKKATQIKNECLKDALKVREDWMPKNYKPSKY